MHSLTTALTIGTVLDSIAEDSEAVCYDALKSAISGIDLDSIEEDNAVDEVDANIVSYLSFIGVKDTVIEDMVSGRQNVSEGAIMAIAQAYSEAYTQDDIESLAEEFADQEEVMLDSIQEDGVSPVRCKSGYKRKMVIKNGKPTWKCVRLFGKVRLSAKQKMALAKARRKAHTAQAKFARNKSVKIGHRKGLY